MRRPPLTRDPQRAGHAAHPDGAERPVTGWRRAHPREHLPACRSPRTSTCWRPRGPSPTSTSSASTGSTCRRCWQRVRQRPRLRRRPTTRPSTPSRGGRRGWRPLSSRGPPARHGRARRHRPQPRRHRPPVGERLVVARAHPRAGVAVRRRVRHRLGGRRRQGPGPGRRRRRPRRRRQDRATCACSPGELHYHDQRFPLAPGTADAEPTTTPTPSTPGSTTSCVHWRRGDAELNYRRFFSVNTLAAIRVEEPEWFEQSHEEIGALVRATASSTGCGSTTPTASATPAKYLDDLAELTGGAYVLVEKILEPRRAAARDAWATAGTTGYDALGADRPGARRPCGRGSRSARSRTGCAARRSTGRR